MPHRVSVASVLLCIGLVRCGGDVAPASRGVVAAASPEAAEAGARILLSGGNAVDAAVAVAFALGVTEPAMSGLGGQTQILLFQDIENGDGAGLVINGTSFAPQATPSGATEEMIVQHRATTIPASVKTLDYAFRRHGSGNVRWAEVLAPAIEYAENGFEVGPFRHEVFRRHLADLRESASASALFLDEDGAPPAEGEVIRQPVLARTLRRLASEGADVFYRGEIARAIASDMAAHGGWVTYEDLASLPEPRELPALRGSYREYDVWTLPPPGGGWVVLQILNLLERSAPSELARESGSRLPRLARALRLGHGSREHRPVTDLVDYGPDVEARISKERAAELLDGGGETTHFSVVDGEGLAVSVTASINGYFGARVASPELGFLYNDYMREFHVETPGHPYALEPKAMPYSSMSPTIVSRDGRPRLVLGSPGSARIISAVAQVVQLWVDEGVPVGEAVAAMRIHALPDGRLYVEGNSGDVSLPGFERVEPAMDLASGAWNPYFGGVHAVAFEEDEWRGAADPRRDGVAIRVRPE